MTIKETEDIIISEFSGFEDWMDKYQYLVEMGRSLPLINPQYRTENYLITGCQSQVWLHASMENGLVNFTADSDAIITKGIVYLLIRVLSGHSPDEILNAGLSFIDQIGLKDHLSPTRANGLLSMVKQMKLYALAFKTKNESKQ